MSENNQEKNDPKDETVDSELGEEELEQAAGGARGMLGGVVLKKASSTAAIGGGQPNELAATSGTTLCDWHNCTQNISGC